MKERERKERKKEKKTPAVPFKGSHLYAHHKLDLDAASTTRGK